MATTTTTTVSAAGETTVTQMGVTAGSKDSNGNSAPYEAFKFTMVEKLPPNSPWSKLSGSPGVQNTSSLTRGQMNDSVIKLLNGNLTAACDPKLSFTLNLSTLGINDPVAAIQDALKSAKNKAMQRLSNLLVDAVKAVRETLKAALELMGTTDFSGEFSFNFQLGKETLRTINESIEWVAAKVEMAMEWIYFYQMINQLIAWIEGLPARLKAMLQKCINQIGQSLTKVVNDIKNLPGAAVSQIQSQVTQLQNSVAAAIQSASSATNDALNAKYDSLTATMPDAVLSLIQNSGSDQETLNAMKQQLESQKAAQEAAAKANYDRQAAGVTSKGA